MEREPYQQASDESVRQSYLPNKILKGAGQLGTAIATGGAVLPFLSKYIPENIMIKGLSKFNPQIGKFITSSLQAGESLDQIKDFIRDKVEPKEEEPIEQKEKFGGAIRRYSEKLMDFIEDNIARGREPHEAGQMALQNKEFEGVIKKMEKDYKSPFSKILESMFGTMQRPEEMQQNNQMELPLGQNQQQMQQGQPQQQQSPQQGGQGQQALMAILQKIQQSRGG
jgi:hypothetical protein